MTRNVSPVTPNGAAIRAIREAQRSSLRELAARAGVSPSYLAHIERGEKTPRRPTVNRIAQALGVPITAISWEEHMAALADGEDADLRLYTAEQVAELWEISKSWLQKAAAERSIECTYLTLPGRSKGLLRFSETQIRQIKAQFTVYPMNANGRKTARTAA
jgi:transcriptional regulator with XRE-family HTH domain